MLTLDFEVDSHMELPLVWISGAIFSQIWALRKSNKEINWLKIRSEMEASCRILRESKVLYYQHSFTIAELEIRPIN